MCFTKGNYHWRLSLALVPGIAIACNLLPKIIQTVLVSWMSQTHLQKDHKHCMQALQTVESEVIIYSLCKNVPCTQTTL